VLNSDKQNVTTSNSSLQNSSTLPGSEDPTGGPQNLGTEPTNPTGPNN
jgi:hypothetical protein